MRLVFDVNTNPGLAGNRNEDSFIADPDLGFFMVADGIGGQQGGGEASRTAALTIHNRLLRSHATIQEYKESPSVANRQKIMGLMRLSVLEANERIHKLSWLRKDTQRMGTTLTGLLISGSTVFVFHVGDSRLYLIRNNRAEQLTVDDSLFSHLKNSGRLNDQQTQSFPLKNIITKAVGLKSKIEPLIFDFKLFPSDKLLLSTDGLHNFFKEDDLVNIINNNEPHDVLTALTSRALDAGGDDDMTGIAISMAGRNNASAVREGDIAPNHPVFNDLTFGEKVRLLSACDRMEFSSGQKIFSQGQSGDGFYIVLRGKVRIQRNNSVVAVFDTGEGFGELSLIYPSTRLVDAVAVEFTQLIRFGSELLLKILDEHKALGVKLLWSLVHILRMRLLDTKDQLALLRAIVGKEVLEQPELFGADIEKED